MHFEAYEDQTGLEHPRLSLPPFPAEFSWHWQTYCEISEGRTSTGWGASSLTWADLHSWCYVKQVRLGALDVTILRAIDEAWLLSYKEASDRREKKGSKDG